MDLQSIKDQLKKALDDNHPISHDDIRDYNILVNRLNKPNIPSAVITQLRGIGFEVYKTHADGFSREGDLICRIKFTGDEKYVMYIFDSVDSNGTRLYNKLVITPMDLFNWSYPHYRRLASVNTTKKYILKN